MGVIGGSCFDMFGDIRESDKPYLMPNWWDEAGLNDTNGKDYGIHLFDIVNSAQGENINFQSVYLIGDFYVGKTKRLGLRLQAHRADAYHPGKTCCGDGIINFMKKNPGKRIPVLSLTWVLEEEDAHIERLRELGFNLVNKIRGVS